MSATEEKTRLECRITVNPEMDCVVFCVGENSVGFDYEHARLMADQLSDALALVSQQRNRPKAKAN